MIAANMRARYATLVHVFHVPIPEIRRLTDRQIDEVYFHPRNERGEIEVPAVETGPRPGSLEHELEQAEQAALLLGVDPAELVEEVRRCHKSRGGPAAGPTTTPT